MEEYKEPKTLANQFREEQTAQKVEELVNHVKSNPSSAGAMDIHESSFRAGIRKVVDWVNKHSNSYVGLEWSYYHNSEWQAFITQELEKGE